jgi:hypothetical protein
MNEKIKTRLKFTPLTIQMLELCEPDTTILAMSVIMTDSGHRMSIQQAQAYLLRAMADGLVTRRYVVEYHKKYHAYTPVQNWREIVDERAAKIDAKYIKTPKRVREIRPKRTTGIYKAPAIAKPTGPRSVFDLR